MTKAELVTEISDQTSIKYSEALKIVEAFFNVVKRSMTNGENVYVRGFGSFVVKKRASKIARNISKNTSVIIPEHYTPTFKPADIFIQQVKATQLIKNKIKVQESKLGKTA